MERIAAAALQPPGQGTYLPLPITLPPPARHHDIIHHMRHDLGFLFAEIAACGQGFVTDTDRFVDRREAWKIAEAAGQLNRLPGGVEGLLFSENLW